MFAPELTTDDFIHTADDPTLRAQWPQRVGELVDVVQAAFIRAHLPPAQAAQLAGVAVLSIAFFAGGRPVYLPIGDRVRKAIQRRQIFTAWQAGATVAELRERFRVSHETVYVAIREGRALAQSGCTST